MHTNRPCVQDHYLRASYTHVHAHTNLGAVPQYFLFLLVLNHRIYWIIRVRREAALVFLFWYKER